MSAFTLVLVLMWGLNDLKPRHCCHCRLLRLFSSQQEINHLHRSSCTDTSRRAPMYTKVFTHLLFMTSWFTVGGYTGENKWKCLQNNTHWKWTRRVQELWAYISLKHFQVPDCILEIQYLHCICTISTLLSFIQKNILKKIMFVHKLDY